MTGYIASPRQARRCSLCLTCLPLIWSCGIRAHEDMTALQTAASTPPPVSAPARAVHEQEGLHKPQWPASSPLARLTRALYNQDSPPDADSSDWAAWRASFMKDWGRKPGEERWQIPEVPLPESRAQEARACLDSLPLTRPLCPSRQHYTYAILLGAPGPIMLERLDWLARQWQQGVRFEQLVVLVSQRPLTPGIDRIPELMTKLLERSTRNPAQWSADSTPPLHETEAARLLLTAYPYPEGMEQVPVKVVDTPRKWQDGNWFRCHTAETFRAWLNPADPPEPGSVLVVSSQPSALYQHAVAARELPPDFSLDTTATPAPQDISLAQLLDGMSTWLRTCETRPPDDLVREASPPAAFQPDDS